MKKNIIFLILIFIKITAFACNCKSITIAEEYKVSDLVFIGDIIKKENGYYLIRVKEVFKGKNSIVDKVFKAFSGSCMINPEQGETWLIFADDLQDYIEISRCGNSTNFDNPFSFKEDFIPPPLSENVSEEINILIKNSYKNKAYNKLLIEINNLRNIKSNKEILNLRIEISNKLNIIKWLLISIISVLLILLILKFKI